VLSTSGANARVMKVAVPQAWKAAPPKTNRDTYVFSVIYKGVAFAH